MQNGRTIQLTVREGQVPIIGLYFIWRLHQSPAHGYALIEEIAGNPIMPSIKPSTIYGLLSNLEEAGYISCSARLEGKRVRKVYHTTPKGMALFQRVRKRFSKANRFRRFAKALLG